MVFSERIGITPLKNSIQKNSMNNELKIGLWNAISQYYFKVELNSMGKYFVSENSNSNVYYICKSLWLDFYKIPIETLSNNWNVNFKIIKARYDNSNWFQVYDLIEFMAEISHKNTRAAFTIYCNKILERENSAYRFIEGKLAEITSDIEIREIEKALGFPFVPTKKHLSRALELLSDRINPDYRNSIKESISSVESLCKYVTNNSNGTLGQALKIIEEKISIHSALRVAFSNLYGYTSDQDGIRHALMGESNILYEDAKFMLVSCSAFVNYILAKSSLIIKD